MQSFLHFFDLKCCNMKMKFSATVLLTSSFIYTFASEQNNHYNNIHVPGFSKLQHIGQHVEIPHPPENIIHVTKTVAIRVPVPYEVKVPYKVPYPVQVNKLYPVEVPKIIHVQSNAVPTGHSSSSSVDNQNQYDVNRDFHFAGNDGRTFESYQPDHRQSYANVDTTFNNNNYGQQHDVDTQTHQSSKSADYDYVSEPQSQYSFGENLPY